MAIYQLGDAVPTIHPDAYVHPQATIIGDVQIGAQASVWPQAVLRGDYGLIVIGDRTSVQDGSVIHAGPNLPTKIGNDCVIGHLAHLEGCRVKDGSLIGSGSIVLHLAVVGRDATVAAGAVVPSQMVVPPGALVAGVPAVVKQTSSSPGHIKVAVAEYIENSRRFRSALRRID